MFRAAISSVFVVVIAAGLATPTRAIEVTAGDNGGPSPQTLAGMIADAGSGVMVVAGSATTQINDGSGGAPSDDRAYGSFVNGATPPESETPLPAANQNANGDATYAGGIATDTGVCLCTGLIEDDPNTTSGRGIGVPGPNNGLNNSGSTYPNPGEISTTLGTPVDQDFANATGLSGTGDATVLQFEVDLASPGFLRISFVFGSDEYPAWVQPPNTVNDSFAIIIDGQHIDPENLATITGNGVTTAFDLFEFQDCGLLFIENDVAPSPVALVGSLHAIPGASFYNIEFGGFSEKLTREISCPLAPGTYTVKLVIQDVTDQVVDSGLFVAEDSLKLFPLRPGDYNGSGCVDAADYTIWQNNLGMSPACFYDGDGNGNGVVDNPDYTIWQQNFGATGNSDCRGDFDRDGDVDMADYAIWNTYDGVLLECASRFEGDADGDGDVDNTDLRIWYGEWDFGCGCGGGGGSVAAANQELTAQLVDAGIDVEERISEPTTAASAGAMLVDRTELPATPDANGDGNVDTGDFAIIETILYGTSGAKSLSTERQLTGDVGDPVPAQEFVAAPALTPEPVPAVAPEPISSNALSRPDGAPQPVNAVPNEQPVPLPLIPRR